jgi:hypothetical protein
MNWKAFGLWIAKTLGTALVEKAVTKTEPTRE